MSLRRQVGRVVRRLAPGRAPNGAPVAGDAPIILMYHRVASPPVDPWGLCIDPGRFDEQMAVVAERSVGTMDDLVDRPADILGTSSLIVTLDDAYTDTVESVLPVVERHQVPITVYVMTAGLAGDRDSWWDQLADLVLASDADTVAALARHPLVVGSLDLSAVDDLHLTLWESLIELGPSERRDAIRDLEETAGRRSGADSELLDLAGVQALHASPLVTIGAHTVSHPPLPQLDPVARRDEIARSVATLSEITGDPIRHFAYPYGRYDEATVDAAQDAGFSTSVTTDPGRVDRAPDLHRLPRVQVPDLDGPAFAAWLDDLLAGGPAT